MGSMGCIKWWIYRSLLVPNLPVGSTATLKRVDDRLGAVDAAAPGPSSDGLKIPCG